MMMMMMLIMLLLMMMMMMVIIIIIIIDWCGKQTLQKCSEIEGHEMFITHYS